MKTVKFAAAFCALSLCLSAFAVDSATVIFKFKDGKASSKSVKTEKIAEGVMRLRLPKAELPKNVEFFEIVADSARVPTGTEGYWVFPRGEMGAFRATDGFYMNEGSSVMPFLGVKTPKETFIALVRGMPYDQTPFVTARKGTYRVGQRWNSESFINGELSEDIVIDYIDLKGEDANYSGMGRAYRKIQLDSGTVKPIRERMKTRPSLEKLSRCISVRLLDCGQKDNPRDFRRGDFTPDNAPPMKVLATFADTGKSMEAVKAQGMDDVSFILNAWQFGGADGAHPSILPIPEELGGMKGLKDVIKRADELGFLFGPNSNHTDTYMVSPMWDPDYVAKNSNGSLHYAGCLMGGNMYYICQKRSWDLFIKSQIEEVRGLGFKDLLYIDVYSARHPDECHDKKHPASRSEQAAYQRKALSYAAEKFGISGSECGFDHCIGSFDFCNYVSSVDYQLKTRWGLDLYKGGSSKKDCIVDSLVPLWEIVYHGIVISTPGRTTQNHPMFGMYDKTPQDMLKLAEFGGRPIVYIFTEKRMSVLRKMYDFFAPLKRLQLEYINKHQKLADGVFLTTFGDGTEILTNYSDKGFAYKNKEVASLTYEMFR